MADDPMPPAGGPPDKAGKKGGGGLGAWIKRNPGPAAAGGLGGGLLLFMLLRKGSNQPADTGATSAPTAGPDPAAYGTSGDLGGVYGQPDYSALANEMGRVDLLLMQIAANGGPQTGTGGSGGSSGHGGSGGGGKKFHGNKYLTKTGHARPWVRRRLHTGGRDLLGGKYFTNTGAPRPRTRKRL